MHPNTEIKQALSVATEMSVFLFPVMRLKTIL